MDKLNAEQSTELRQINNMLSQITRAEIPLDEGLLEEVLLATRNLFKSISEGDFIS